MLLCFLGLAIAFHRRCKRAGLLRHNLRNVLLTLYASTSIIFIRTIYRTVEYFLIVNTDFSNPNLDPDTLSPVVRYEWFFYVFEAIPMFVNTFLLNASHPAKYLPRSNKVFLAEDGKTEIEGPGYHDKRFWLITLFDPFDIVGLIRNRIMGKGSLKYWEQGQQGAVTTLAEGPDRNEVKAEGVSEKV